MRWWHHVAGSLFALLWVAALLQVMALLHQRQLPPPKKPKKRIPPAFATIRRPPPPRNDQPVQRSAAPLPAAPASLLPALKLPSPVPLPSIPQVTSATGQTGLLHPGGGNGVGGAGGGRQAMILTEELVDKPPQLVLRVPPSYPAHAETNNIEGEVFVRILVGIRGRVERVVVLRSRPTGVFDAATREAVMRWRFRPAQFRGKPVRTWLRQRVAFKLK